MSWSSTLQQAWLRRGLLALALLPLAAVFALLSAMRRALYRLHILNARSLPVPVIVVGNLIAGGAGKTPTVIAIAQLLRHHGYTPGIVSRGHGRRGGGERLEVSAPTNAADCGDEPKLLSLRTRAPVFVGRDRHAAAQALLERHPEVDVIVSDDGLQHLALARDIQVIVFDERGLGNGWLLPAGPLREPFSAAVPARSLVLYNAPRASTPWPGSLGVGALAGVASLQAWQHGEAPSLAQLKQLKGRPLLAAAGIANPQRFFELLRQHGLAIESLPLPDHHAYATLPWPASTGDVLVTEKDAVKFDPARIGATRVWVAALDFHTSPSFERALISMLRRARLRGAPHGSSIA